MQKNPIADTVFMVEPTTFAFDEQTAKSNTFQHHLGVDNAAITAAAIKEFRAFAAKLRKNGITTITFTDTVDPPKPNAVFPNNWLSTWPDGRVFVYPMATQSRRAERSPLALQKIAETHIVGDIIDISENEKTRHYLESTGVMVFDHASKHVFACISMRCDEMLLRTHAETLGYTPIIFHASDKLGMPIYHTNVMMSIQSTTAVVCSESIASSAERKLVIDELQKTGHEIIDISLEQMNAFCGNVLELKNNRSEHFLILSRAAFDAFTPAQRIALSKDKTLLPVTIPTIETIGGGGARCMITEIFLPKKPQRITSAILSENVITI